ncbi:MAG: Na+/H+ antiporter subunit E [Caldithrix sp.]|nr:Na+/H+ antiporter subunit E [Caldithrix sp.]
MKNLFTINVLLAIIWSALTGIFSPENLGVGFLLGFFMLWTLQAVYGKKRYFSRAFKVLSLVVYFLIQLFKANLRVAMDIVTARHYMVPGIIKLPLDARTDLEITLLANLISLTPGTLSLDVTQDKRFLVIHAMYVENVQDFKHDLKNGFEKRLLEVLR